MYSYPPGKFCESRPVWGTRQLPALWFLLKGFLIEKKDNI